jgi:Protein of unknown function (DUF3999)
MNKLKIWLVAIAAFWTVGAAPNEPDGDPSAYSLRLPLGPVGDAPVQRFSVPTQALIASQSPQMSDVRVFDGNGRLVPMARIDNQLPALEETTLPAQPILGSNVTQNATGVALGIDQQGRVQIVPVDGAVSSDVKTTKVVGALFDARGQTGFAERLSLTITTPEGQPVTLTVEASEDLKTWSALGDRVIYRRPGEGSVSRDEVVELRGPLKGNTQLRVTWRSDTPLLAPIVLGKAALASRRAAIAMNKSVTANLPPLLDGYMLEFAVPFVTPIQTIAIDVKGGEGLLPVTILGRNNKEEPWTLLGQGSASKGAAPIKLNGQSKAVIRIEADRRTSGFTASPVIRFGLASPQIAFVTTGTPPFTFAAGRASAPDVFLSLQSIMPAGIAATIPEASILDSAIGPITLSPFADGSASWRSLILWAILLGVTLLLAGISWHLWSRRSAEN